MEFMFWTEYHYSDSSTEYLNTLPDKNVWLTIGNGYSNLSSYYYGHPAYREYPIVGISYDQAVAYSRWRSDRVFESILWRNRVIPKNLTWALDSIFTIEKYFNGEYYGLEPYSDTIMYPYYFLPDSLIYRTVEQFAQNINNRNRKYCDRKCNLYSLTENHCVDEREEISKMVNPSLTKPVKCFSCKRDLITHVQGNVSEMTADPGWVFGSNFAKPCELSNKVWRVDTAVSAYIGFRNACEYRLWTKPKN
jgi:hypothetical protein